MKYAVIYSSPTGNTKMLAEKVRETMSGHECLYFGAPAGEAKAAADEAELLFVGFWTDKGSCDEKLADFLEELEGKRIVLFGTAGFGQDEEYFSRILYNVQTHLKESNTVAASWMCQGKMPMPVRKRYEAMQETQPEKAREMIDNFDEALKHPNEQDLNRLEAVIKSIELN